MSVSDGIRLPVSPFNMFNIQCNVSYYPPDASALTFQFSHTDDNTYDSSMNTTVSVDNSKRNTQTVVITGAANNTEEVYQYSCTVNVTDDNTAASFIDSVSVLVRGRYNS